MTRDVIALASDHAGVEMKSALKEAARVRGLEVLDLGAHDEAGSVDYPDMADALAAAMADGRADRGVLVCGSGIGISIAANRHRHLRAALCHTAEAARLARQHPAATVLAMGARVIGPETARECLEAFLDTAFEGGRHARRVEKLG